jgi:hypothetical protein
MHGSEPIDLRKLIRQLNQSIPAPGKAKAGPVPVQPPVPEEATQVGIPILRPGEATQVPIQLPKPEELKPPTPARPLRPESAMPIPTSLPIQEEATQGPIRILNPGAQTPSQHAVSKKPPDAKSLLAAIADLLAGKHFKMQPGPESLKVPAIRLRKKMSAYIPPVVPYIAG